MPQEAFVAFDLGAESGRAIVGTLRDGRLHLEEKHRFLNPTSRVSGHLHWNILAQWEELKTGLRKAAAESKGDFAGIGVDTWGVDFGFLAKNGELLGNPYVYRDSRTDGVMERMFARVPRGEIYQATGIQFMQLNSLVQVMAAREMQSPILDCADSMLFVPDLFNYFFTGQRKCEFSITTTSQMYDPRQKSWSIPMLQKLGLPTHFLGEIIPSGTLLGPLTADVQKECGVGAIPVIATACHDTASAVAAVPAEGQDWCYISSGTWSLMGVELPAPIINDKALKYNYTNEGGVGGSIRFLRNIMGMWPFQECRRHWLRQGEDYSYAALARMAAEARPFESILNLDHPPFLKPTDMPIKIEEYCRQTKQPVPHEKGHFVRAIFESLALSYRRTIEGLEDILGRKIKVIHIVGGGSQNELLNQMTADACGKTVIAGPIEATAAGNVLVQALAAGLVKDLAEIRSIVRASFEVKRYTPGDATGWDAAYTRFGELVR